MSPTVFSKSTAVADRATTFARASIASPFTSLGRGGTTTVSNTEAGRALIVCAAILSGAAKRKAIVATDGTRAS